MTSEETLRLQDFVDTDDGIIDNIAITGTERREDIRKPFTVYFIEVKDTSGSVNIVERRFDEFHRFHRNLKAAFPHVTLPEPPPKLAMGSLRPQVVEHRRLLLEQYLNELLEFSHDTHEYLREFLPNTPSMRREGVSGDGYRVLRSWRLIGGTNVRLESKTTLSGEHHIVREVSKDGIPRYSVPFGEVKGVILSWMRPLELVLETSKGASARFYIINGRHELVKALSDLNPSLLTYRNNMVPYDVRCHGKPLSYNGPDRRVRQVMEMDEFVFKLAPIVHDRMSQSSACLLGLSGTSLVVVEVEVIRNENAVLTCSAKSDSSRLEIQCIDPVMPISDQDDHILLDVNT